LERQEGPSIWVIANNLRRQPPNDGVEDLLPNSDE